MFSIRRATTQSLEIVSRNPSIILPLILQSLLLSSLQVLIFLPVLSAGADLSQLDPAAVLQNPSQFALGGMLFLAAAVLVHTFFDSMLLGMIREAWKKGRTAFRLQLGARYFAPLLGVKLARWLIVVSLAAGTLLPLLVAGWIARLLAIIASSLLLMLLVFAAFSLFWVRESVVADRKGALSALERSYAFFKKNKASSLLLAVVIILLWATVGIVEGIYQYLSFSRFSGGVYFVAGTIALLLSMFLMAFISALKLSVYLQQAQ